jgi:predicted LPLAT superfamily acyltransferase
MTSPTEDRWQDVAEKGSVLAIRLLVVLATTLGRPAARAALHLVAAWYVLFHPAVRRASRDYLVRLQRRAGLADVYRHVLCFARVTLDRLFLVRGDARSFELSFNGEAHLRALRDSRRGALLLLSHVGSFEVLRASSEARDLPVAFLGYFRNARMINAALRELNPAVDAQLIEIRPGDPSFVLEVEQRIAEGSPVGTMSDRVGFDGKSVVAPFLGTPARFPPGPYLLAAALGCPVYLVFCLYREPNRYELHCEPFAERVSLPRAARAEALAGYAARYAARLEHYCRLAPLNWFNFYDFWSRS